MKFKGKQARFIRENEIIHSGFRMKKGLKEGVRPPQPMGLIQARDRGVLNEGGMEKCAWGLRRIFRIDMSALADELDFISKVGEPIGEGFLV